MKELKRQSFLNLIVLLLAVLLSQMTWAQQNIPFNAIIVPEDAFMFYLEQDVTGAPKKTESHSQNYYGGNKSYPQLYNAYQLSPVTFSSSNQGVATIDQTTGVITAVGIGSTTISAYFGGNDAFFEKSTSYTLTFTDDRDDMEISGVAFSSSTASATYGDKTANTPTISSGKLGNATFTYSSSNEGVAMVDNIGTVTIKGAGTAEIKASFAGNDNFKPGYLTYTLTVAQKEVGITWGTTKFTYDGSSHVPTATATGLIGSDVCTINVEGEKTDAGSYTATASSISNANYMLPADKSTSFTISKAVPSVTAAPSANSLTYTGSAQALVTAGTASGGTMQYSLDKQTYSEAIPTGTDAGSYTVYYRVVGDANHEDADGGQVSVTIDKAASSVAFASNTANAKIGESYTSQTATTSPSGLPLTYSSSNTGVAMVDVSSGTITLVSPGFTTITASFAGNDNYNAAQGSYELSVAKADAVDVELSFSSSTATATYGDAAVNAPALNNPHQLPLVWTSSNENVAKVDASGNITIVGAGQTTIYASFVGNDDYKAKVASFTLTVNKATASVTFTSKTANAKMGEGYASQTATTSPAGLPLTYSSSNSGVATVDASSGTVTLVSPGSTTITASFAGNDNYNAAQDSYELSVAKADAVEVELSFGSETATATYGDAAVNAPTLNNPHQLPLVWTSSNENVATVNAFGNITIAGAGQAFIYASFVGNDEYRAKTISFILTVNKYPVSVAFATSAETATLGEDFVSPKATVIPSGITLVYSSSDPNVASVDAYMGEVTLLGEGTVMITAAFNGSDNFESASAYYYLTIEEATPRLEPIVKEVEYPLDVDAYFINADGSEVDLSNAIVNNILFTLKNQGSPEGDGYDMEDHCIVINTVTPTSTVNALLANNVVPGSVDYASQFTGLSFLVPAGEGYIIVTSQEADGVYLMVKVGENDPVSIHLSEMGDYSIPYKSDFLTMVRMWRGDSDAQSYASTRGKKKMADVRVTKVTYKAVSSNGIQRVSVDAFDDNHWYDMNGLRISQPVKKGVYIHGNRKVVIK